MHVSHMYIDGFRSLTQFDLSLNASLTVLIGDNETGKSTVLEAVGLVLSGLYDGRFIQYAIDPYLFNATAVAEFFAKRQNGEQIDAPRILIEAYLQGCPDDPALARLSGTNNTKSQDSPGLVLTVDVDSAYLDALKDYAADDGNPTVLPIEFYKISWRSFAGNGVTLRALPFRAQMIDTSHTRVHRGPTKYLSQVISDVLDEDQRRTLSLAYKRLRHEFSQEPGVATINQHLETQGNPATKKKLTVQMDMSSRASWDTTITAHLDDLPFDCAGKGEQCRVQLRLAIVAADKSRVLLIEEPENHLSHSNLNMLMDDIQEDCGDRQVIVATHSAFVLNKLGIDNLRLISQNGQTAALTGLASDTKNYFLKLPGYDTLRLILARRSILVEGPSDELIVQRAYKDKHGRLPLEDGVDVIAVGSLAFKRFLEIAALLGLNVSVIMDNDGDVASLTARYREYIDATESTIHIYYDTDESCQTLEPQLLKANSLDTLNMILGTKHSDGDALLRHMARNKTDCALRLFQTNDAWLAPDYIARAID